MTGDNIAGGLREKSGPNISFRPAASVLRISRSRSYRSGNLQHECPRVLYSTSPENYRVRRLLANSTSRGTISSRDYCMAHHVKFLCPTSSRDTDAWTMIINFVPVVKVMEKNNNYTFITALSGGYKNRFYTHEGTRGLLSRGQTTLAMKRRRAGCQRNLESFPQTSSVPVSLIYRQRNLSQHLTLSSIE